MPNCPRCPPIPPPVSRIWDPHGDAEQERVYMASSFEPVVSIAFTCHGQGVEREATRRLGRVPQQTVRLA